MLVLEQSSYLQTEWCIRRRCGREGRERERGLLPADLDRKGGRQGQNGLFVFPAIAIYMWLANQQTESAADQNRKRSYPGQSKPIAGRSKKQPQETNRNRSNAGHPNLSRANRRPITTTGQSEPIAADHPKLIAGQSKPATAVDQSRRPTTD